MFAVIATGGKQYKVAAGDMLEIERLPGEAGEAIEFTQVLAIGEGSELVVGKPHVAGASVSATIMARTRGPKIIVFKKRRRQNSRRKNGHRQDLTAIKIVKIASGDLGA
jgi:large subunit ribosomal protein L21